MGGLSRHARSGWFAALQIVVLGMSQHCTTNRHPESGRERKSGRHALAELQRLSRLAPEVLRADGIRSCLGPGVATGTAGLGADRAFQRAGKKGLDPEDYDASRWEERIRALQGASSGPAVARFDVALTVCTMRYVSDLRIGRINPQHFEFGLSVEQKKYDLAQFLRDRILTASDLQAVLDEVEPPFPGYRRTEQALAHYIELARTDDGEKLPDVTKPIDPGQPYLGRASSSQSLATRGRPAGGCHASQRHADLRRAARGCGQTLPAPPWPG